jgi:hypothetical protein
MKVTIALTLMLVFTSCFSLNPQQKGTKPPTHDAFTALLQEFVDEQGSVNYGGLLAKKQALTTYLRMLSDQPPNDELWTEQEKLAYWINVYNGFTLQLILDHYPVSSIKEIGSKVQIPFVNTPWDIKFIRIGKDMLDLNNVEHNILRKNFNEPRIHFAINCASVSCPVLRNEAFEAAKIEEQLADQAKRFLNDPTKNDFSDPLNPQLSKIFQWFKGDFTKEGSLEEFI